MNEDIRDSHEWDINYFINAIIGKMSYDGDLSMNRVEMIHSDATRDVTERVEIYDDRCDSFDIFMNIPQIDGAFDDDYVYGGDGSDNDYNADVANDDDSDFEISKDKKKKTPLKKGKQNKRKGKSPVKKRKNYDSDDDDTGNVRSKRNNYKSGHSHASPIAERKRQNNSHDFGSLLKGQKSVSDLLSNTFSFNTKDRTKRGFSPIEVSFSDSDDPYDKWKMNDNKSKSKKKGPQKKKPANTKRKGKVKAYDTTPDVSEESDIDKTKPGPKSSKVNDGYDTSSKPGPKSSKRNTRSGSDTKQASIEADFFKNWMSASTSSAITCDSLFELPSTSKESSFTTSKALPKKNSKKINVKNVTETFTDDYFWVSIRDNTVKLNSNSITEEDIEKCGNEFLGVSKTQHYMIEDPIRDYRLHKQYWKSEMEKCGEFGVLRNTRSKGAVKEFYTQSIKTPPKKPAPKKWGPNKGAAKNVRSAEKNLFNDYEEEYVKPLRGARSSVKKTDDKIGYTPKVQTPKNKNANKRKTNAASRRTSKRIESKASVTRSKSGVTSSTLYTTESIPFVESDISTISKDVELKGNEKIAYLKSLCHDVTITCVKMDDAQYEEYKYDVSPYLFNDIVDLDKRIVSQVLKGIVEKVVRKERYETFGCFETAVDAEEVDDEEENDDNYVCETQIEYEIIPIELENKMKTHDEDSNNENNNNNNTQNGNGDDGSCRGDGNCNTNSEASLEKYQHIVEGESEFIVMKKLDLIVKETKNSPKSDTSDGKRNIGTQAESDEFSLASSPQSADSPNEQQTGQYEGIQSFQECNNENEDNEEASDSGTDDYEDDHEQVPVEENSSFQVNQTQYNAHSFEYTAHHTPNVPYFDRSHSVPCQNINVPPQLPPQMAIIDPLNWRQNPHHQHTQFVHNSDLIPPNMFESNSNVNVHNSNNFNTNYQYFYPNVPQYDGTMSED